MIFKANNPRPTVCHVLHSLDVGGGELLARDLALAHARQFRPVFALLDNLGKLGKALRTEGFHTEVFDRRPGIDLVCALRLRRFFKREGVELVHAHQYGPLFFSALARCPFTKPPILFLEHGRDHPDYRRPKRVWANRILLHASDRFVAVGEAVRRALIDFEGLPAARIEVVHNGVALDRFAPGLADRPQVRAAFGWSDDTLVIIQVARLNRLKDQATALRVMKALNEFRTQARLVLVGDGEEREALERERAALGLESCVEFLGMRSDIPRLLGAADIFLLTSISEGIPLTLIEAMAAGLPCIATRVGGVAEVVVDGETGLLAEAGDPPALARRLSLLAGDPALRERLGNAGRQRALAQFDADRMHRRYLEVYREMTGITSRTDSASAEGAS